MLATALEAIIATAMPRGNIFYFKENWQVAFQAVPAAPAQPMAMGLLPLRFAPLQGFGLAVEPSRAITAAMGILDLPYDRFLAAVRQALDGRATPARSVCPAPDASAVIFLLGRSPAGEPLVIFNKRSACVRQPGDLCFPGGSISPRLDPFVARILRWLPLPGWRHLQRANGGLALLLATGLREAFEEMGLNPLRLSYLGLLPTQRLVMFQRDIHPLVCGLNGQQRFSPNWEVAKVVCLPLRTLLDPRGYARYHLCIAAPGDATCAAATLQMLCFCIGHGPEREVLWGATFRMVLAFLDLLFGFTPPALDALPVVYGRLDETYMGRPAGLPLSGEPRQ